MEATTCHICQFDLAGETGIGSGLEAFDCPRCGLWTSLPPRNVANGTITEQLTRDVAKTLHRRSRLSHLVRRQGVEGKVVGVNPDLLPQWGLDQPLQSPFEQLDDLILWTGDHQPDPNEIADWTFTALGAWLGTRIDPFRQSRSLHWLIDQDQFRHFLVRTAGGGDTVGFQLTMEGWARYEELRTTQTDSRVGFMAMPFRFDDLTAVVSDVFVPAALRAGFELRKITDAQRAGLIDDQLRVALRTCRFVVADITHGNLGAHWEAGFGEGLGKPVIYTCRKKEWEDGMPHFDTNHLLTIIWDPANLQDAGVRLTAAIRATLPAEAKLSDD